MPLRQSVGVSHRQGGGRGVIGSLRGTIVDRSTEFALIDVGGVGYLVHCSNRTLAELPENGATVHLYTDLLVREDLLQLFGFATLRDRELHRILVSVQGVGAKAALAIAGALGTDGTIRAVTLGDPGAIRTAPGVGPKLAQRIVHELQEKITELISWVEEGSRMSEPGEGETETGASQSAPTRQLSKAGVSAEALSALMNLGYQQVEAARAIAEASGKNSDAGTAELIREALLRLAPA